MPVSEATLSASPSKPQLQCGSGWPWLEEAVHRDVHVAELAGEPRRALDDLPRLDDAAAEPGADDRGDRRALRRQRPEELVVRVERGRVAVVVVDDGEPQALLEGAAEVEAAPARVGEVRGPARRDDAVGARRARRVEPDRAHALARDPGPAQDVLEREDEGLDRDLRPLGDAARALDQLVDEKAPRGVEDGGVVLVAPVVEPHHHPAVGLHHHSFPDAGFYV